jgi:hypothetical protein
VSATSHPDWTRYPDIFLLMDRQDVHLYQIDANSRRGIREFWVQYEWSPPVVSYPEEEEVVERLSGEQIAGEI